LPYLVEELLGVVLRHVPGDVDGRQTGYGEAVAPLQIVLVVLL
jgi:hypothetical protein